MYYRRFLTLPVHNTIKHISLLALIITSAWSAASQQQIQLSQFFADYTLFNPAFAGRNYQTDVSVIHRQQWVGLDGAPVTTLAGVNTRILQGKMGVGLNAFSDRIGAFNHTGVRLSFAGSKRMGLNQFRFAIAPSFYSYSLSGNFSALDGSDNDPVLNQGNIASTAVDVNVGFLYETPDYFVGLSALNLLGARVGDLALQQVRTLNVVAGYQFNEIFIPDVGFYPTLLAKADLSNISGITIDVNLIALYKKSFFAGLGFRPGDALYPMLGYQWFNSLGKFRLGYAYDYTTTNINNVSNGTHEVILNYSYFISRSGTLKQYKNVRFL